MSSGTRRTTHTVLSPTGRAWLFRPAGIGMHGRVSSTSPSRTRRSISGATPPVPPSNCSHMASPSSCRHVWKVTRGVAAAATVGEVMVQVWAAGQFARRLTSLGLVASDGQDAEGSGHRCERPQWPAGRGLDLRDRTGGRDVEPLAVVADGNGVHETIGEVA